MKAFGKTLTRDVTKAQKESANKIGKTGLVLAAGVALGAKKAIDSAKDLVEAQSAVAATFKGSSKEVLAWSKSTNDAFSQTEFNQAIKSYAVFGQAAGLADKANAKFSKGLVDAAQDLSSFHNADPSEVLDNIKSGLTGETEPLRKYGILISEANVNAAAMSMGLVKNVKNLDEIKAAQFKATDAQAAYTTAVKEHGAKSIEAQKAQLALRQANAGVKEALKGQTPELTDQQKILARRELIMKSLGPATGDWARTIESAANQERLMNANSEDTLATLGQGLLPVYKQLLSIVTDVVSWFGKHTGVTKVLFGTVAALAGAMLIYAGTVRVTMAAQKAYATVMALYKIATGQATAAQLGLNAALIANPIGIVVVAIAALVVGLVIAYKKSETFRKIVDGAFNGVKATVGFVVGFIRNHWRLLVPLLLLPIAPLLLVAFNFRKIVGAAQSAYSGVKNVFGKIVGFLSGMPHKFSGALSGLWNGIVSGLRGAWNTVAGFLNGLNVTVNVPDVLPGPDSYTIGVSGVPMLAKGGVLPSGMLGIVGERGAELAIGGRGGTTVAPLGGASAAGLRIEGTLDLGDGLEGRIEGVLKAGGRHAGQLGRMRR
jgi:hypothetical protein